MILRAEPVNQCRQCAWGCEEDPSRIQLLHIHARYSCRAGHGSFTADSLACKDVRLACLHSNSSLQPNKLTARELRWRPLFEGEGVEPCRGASVRACGPSARPCCARSVAPGAPRPTAGTAPGTAARSARARAAPIAARRSPLRLHVPALDLPEELRRTFPHRAATDLC